MKSAAKLGITKEERDALMKVRDGLASGAFVHKTWRAFDHATSKSRKPIFNMDIPHRTNHCGTAACIGGWVAKELAKNPSDYVFSKNGQPIKNLFFPSNDVDNWNNIKTHHAVAAIDSFLNTGKVDYVAILKGAA